jgi:hypothetical protein
MNINGTNTLACLCRITDGDEPMTVYPLPHMEVVKGVFDIVVTCFRVSLASCDVCYRLGSGSEQLLRPVQVHQALVGAGSGEEGGCGRVPAGALPRFVL